MSKVPHFFTLVAQPSCKQVLKDERSCDYFTSYKVIYCGVFTTRPLEDREFQFVYICSLISNTEFIREQKGSKWQFENNFLHAFTVL